MGVSPYRQVDLLNYFTITLQSTSPRELIPNHPMGDFMTVLDSYRAAFYTIHRYVLKYKEEDRRHLFFSGLALRWMRGDSLRKLITSSIKYNEEKSAEPDSRVRLKSRALIIRETMDSVEEDLRFRYVKLFTCYNSLLGLALTSCGKSEYTGSIPNIPLFLEMGASSGTMINMMAMGLSRTTAEALNVYATNKDMTLEQTCAWLKRLPYARLDISPICVRELELILGSI